MFDLCSLTKINKSLNKQTTTITTTTTTIINNNNNNNNNNKQEGLSHSFGQTKGV